MVSEREFDTLFRNLYGELYVFARRFIAHEADCEDIVSDAFEDVWRNLSCLTSATVRSFLYRDVRNKCIDFLRRQTVRRQYADLMASVTQGYDSADGLTELHERERIVSDVLESLPDYTRQIFTACYVDRKQYAQVAEELSISPNTVKKYISQALKLIVGQRQKH
jgi:RNA polymerase sigma-70 factor (ECF subfamily)